MVGQTEALGTGAGKRPVSPERKKVCYRKKTISFPKRNRKQNL